MADLLTNLAAAAGAAGGDKLYIEDVFSTYLYTGTNAAQTITNGIDLDGEGGMLWLKSRSSTADHTIQDTVRGNRYQLIPSQVGTSNINSGPTVGVTSFTSSGFTLGTNYQGENPSGASMCSWTFRKAPKFFDVLTYTGTGSARTVSHNLGSVPGCIIVKRMDTNADWQVYHRANTAAPETDYLVLNSTAATADSNTRWNDTLPTDTVFTVGTEATVNASGGTYVAYLFAHDAGGFGDDGEQNVVTCGGFTSPGSGDSVVTLGYEPQFILFKAATGAAQAWTMFDTFRGMSYQAGRELLPNSSAAETDGWTVKPTATGFSAGVSLNRDYIYIAIRRGPMKTPTAGTEVFGLSARTGTGANATVTGGAGVADAVLIKNRGAAVGDLFAPRLTGTGYLETSSTAAEVAAASTILQANPWDVMDGVKVGTSSTITNASANTYINYLFGRAPGFFDVVCYTGTGVARTVAHNLGVAPEMMIVKRRDSAGPDWAIYYGDPTDYLKFTTAATADDNTYWNDTAPTSAVFSLGNKSDVNASGGTYVAYLFASCPGVSKVGTYAGTGAAQTINCGFSNGARFVLIKAINATSSWPVWDTARGIVVGDDPNFLLNTTAAESTSPGLTPENSGFGLTTSFNTSGVNFLFLAIA